MLNFVFAFMIIISIICAILTGRVQDLSSTILNSANEAITLVISMVGMMCLWSGLMKIADRGGLMNILAKVFFPILRRLFPHLQEKDAALKAICLNLTANLLGLGNAATPLGINAMKELQKKNPNKKVASNEMILFVILNTASIQIMPTFMIMLRQQHGSVAPFEVLPSVFLASLCALIGAVILAKLLEKNKK